MTWLKEKLQSKTMRDFAVELLKRKDWPKSVELKPDSLRNQLRNADTRVGTGWWLEGKGKPVLEPLKNALGLSREEIVRQLSQPAALQEKGARIELDTFEGVFIDLENDEDFVPGFPSEMSVNGGRHLDCAWWKTSDSVAVGWLGRWLEHRFDWRFERMERWVVGSLPSKGRVFVELATVDGLPPDWASTVPVETHVCIACRFPPPEKNSETTSRQNHESQQRPEARPVTTLTTPPPRDWIDKLITWLAPRVPPKGRFKERIATRLTHAEYDGTVAADVREVLSFLELVDNHEERHFGEDRSRLIREWVSNAEARAVPESEHVVAKSGDEVLLALNSARLKEVLPANLTCEEWRKLLPEDFLPARIRKEIDHRVQIGGANNASKLRKLLDPKQVDWVDGLLRCEVLLQSDDGLVSIHPPLLARLVDALSFEHLWESTDGLGTLMLNSTTAGKAISRVIDELRAGDFSRTEAWLVGKEQDHSPERLAACDGIFRAIGLVLTEPKTRVPLPLIRQAWATYTSFSKEVYPFRPRIPLVTVGGSADQRGLNAEGAHCLAASAISLHLLREGDAMTPSALTPSPELLGKPSDQPWSSNYWEPARRIFSLMAKAFRDAPSGSNEQLAPYRLAEALLQQFGPTNVYELNDLQQPAAIALYAKNASNENALGRAGAIGLAAVSDACTRHGVTVEHALSEAWKSWVRRGFNYGFPRLDAETARTVFSALTAEHLAAGNRGLKEDLSPPDPERLLSLRELGEHPEVWPFLRAEIWDYWVDTGFISSAMLTYFPETAVQRVLRKPEYWLRSGGSISTSALWTTFPRVVIEFIHGVVTGREQKSYWLPLASAAPPTSIRELVKLLSGHDDAFVHEWMIAVVEQRQPGWRDAAHHLMALHGGTVALGSP